MTEIRKPMNHQPILVNAEPDTMKYVVDNSRPASYYLKQNSGGGGGDKQKSSSKKRTLTKKKSSSSVSKKTGDLTKRKTVANYLRRLYV